MSSILYIGSASGTSLQRADALRRLGHDVTQLPLQPGLPKRWALWLNRTGGFGLDTLAANYARREIAGRSFDLALVDSGDVVGPATLRVLRQAAPVVGNYNADNPYRDPPTERRRWTLFRRAMADYDLNVAIRREGLEQQMRRKGVRNPMLIWQCADEAIHRVGGAADEIEEQWRSEVAFVGTWMPGRGAFMAALADRGVPLAIYGPRWQKAPEFERLAPLIRSDYLEGDDYRKAIAGSKVAIVLLNGDNDDLHTKRSVEIPAIGTAMCALRTPYHLDLYREDEEALFFDDADECARQCKRLLADDELRRRIAAAGHRRTFVNGTYNEPLMKNIVEELLRVRDRTVGRAA